MTTAKKAILAGSVAAAFALAAPTAAFAQDMGFYLGGSLGQAEAKDWCDTGGEAGLTINSCDDKDTAWKLFAGYRFHRNIAAELSYIQLGDFTANVTYLGTPISINADGKAFGIAALGIWPVSPQFDVFGKLGFLRTEVEATGTSGGTSVTLGENETEAHYGIGAAFNFTRNLGLRAEWERADKSKLDFWSIGLQYKF
jgi:opacity protein-like surface antigen